MVLSLRFEISFTLENYLGFYISLPSKEVSICNAKNANIGDISIPLMGGMILLKGSRNGIKRLSRNL